MIGWIILGLLIIIALAWVSIYNKLIRVRNGVEGSFSQVDVQLQRRNDLIPNLVETVKGYAKHESETLQAVIKARQQMVDLPADATPEQINQTSNELSGALSRLMVVVEQYPELKANTNFLQLQESLEDTENKIAVARQLYNSSVQQYNQSIQTVPNNIVAGLHHFEMKKYLEAPQEAKMAPKVSF